MKPRTKKVLIVGVISTLSLCLLELLLRLLGYIPGSYINQHNLSDFTFEKLDTARFIPILDVKEEGILHHYPISDTSGISYILQQQIPTVMWPQNELGFRNMWHLADTAKKERIMLLGDSFTWGFDAHPADSSFANRLQQAHPDAAIFNMAIAGTDLATYTYLAEKWIPVLKPQTCVVNFFVNDFIYYDKKPIPYLNQDVFALSSGVFFATNADSYTKDSVEVFASPEEARKYMTQKFFFEPKNGIEHLMAKTALGTLLAKIFVKPQPVKTVKFKRNPNSNENCLARLQKVCVANNVKLILSFIPDNMHPDNTEAAEAQIKKGFPQHYKLFNVPKNLTLQDYNGKPKWHFNNQGHLKYFQHINALIN